MSTALQLVPRPDRPTTPRRASIREAVDAWRRTDARHLSIESIERLIDALTKTDADSRQASRSEVERLDDAVADIHTAYQRLDDAESTLATLRRVLTGQPER